MIRVAGRTATITYTDIHLERLLFFQDLLGRLGRRLGGHALAQR